MEDRRNSRIVVTFPVRVHFLKMCRKVAKKKGTRNKIHVDELILLRDEAKEQVESRSVESLSRKLGSLLGFRDRDAKLLEVFERAIERVDEIKGEWLYYRDFNFYDTTLEPYWPWMRSGAIGVAFVLFGFYLFTAILFCPIMNDDGVCPRDPTGDRSYYGWLTAVYFASVTMSTVGKYSAAYQISCMGWSFLHRPSIVIT